MGTVLTPNKGLSQIATGDDAGTWGPVTNTNWGLVDSALGGGATISMSDADTTVTTTQAANLRLAFAGTLTAFRNISLPAVGGFYVITNATSGGWYLRVVTMAAGSGVIVPNGVTLLLVSDGTNVFYGSNPSRIPLTPGTVTVAPGTTAFNLLLPPGFNQFEFEWQEWQATVDGATGFFLVSQDYGNSYDNTMGDYIGSFIVPTGTTTNHQTQATSLNDFPDNGVHFTGSINKDLPTYGSHGAMKIWPGTSSVCPWFEFQTTLRDLNYFHTVYIGSYCRNAVGRMTNLQFGTSAGTIAGAKYRLWGVL